MLSWPKADYGNVSSKGCGAPRLRSAPIIIQSLPRVSLEALWRPHAGAWAALGPSNASRDPPKGCQMDAKSILIGALLIVVAVLGYLYWDSQHNTILKAPGVEIRKN